MYINVIGSALESVSPSLPEVMYINVIGSALESVSPSPR